MAAAPCIFCSPGYPHCPHVRALTKCSPLHVVSGTTASMEAVLAGAESLVIAVGFVPGNPLKMGAAAHEVDNIGTCKLIVSSR